MYFCVYAYTYGTRSIICVIRNRADTATCVSSNAAVSFPALER